MLTVYSFSFNFEEKKVDFWPLKMLLNNIEQPNTVPTCGFRSGPQRNIFSELPVSLY